MTTAQGATRRHEVKGTFAKTVLSYVRRVLGEDAVATVFRRAGWDVDGAGLAESASWTTHETTVAIAEAAAEVCGDPDIGRRAGEELMRIARERDTIDFVRAAGSVAAALELVANVSTQMSQGRTHEVVEVGEGHATIECAYADPRHAHAFYCGYAAGYFGLIPGVFGLDGVVTESECMRRGDETCVIRLRWSAPSRLAPSVATGDIEESRERVDSLVARFEELHHMATELAGAEDVDTLLARITDRALVAVGAPRNLLAVRTADGGRLHVHHRGFEEDRAAESITRRLLAGELEEGGHTLVEEVASDGRAYGWLVAMYPRGSTPTEMERRLLGAYARHAAAALEAVASLEGARRDRDVAQGLLGLADALAQAGSRTDVAERLAAALPTVVERAHAHVWLWDPNAGLLRLEEQCPPSGAGRPRTVAASEVPEVARFVADPAPALMDREAFPAEIADLAPPDGPPRWALVPIQARGRFFGLVCVGAPSFAGLTPDSAPGSDLLARLRGMADQAATALDNAELIEHIRAQALVDALTGLPNRTLLEDRTRTALRQAARADHGISLVFIDLDDFKKVNDTLGHHAGDEVIVAAANRLHGCLRASDTLARIGGDEFVALLPDNGRENLVRPVVDKIHEAFAAPFAVAGQEVLLSCSVGIACSPQHGTDHEALLRTADAAMYEVKRTGGAASGVAEDVPRERSPVRLGLESRLRSAIEHGELTVLYQPQVDLETLELSGVEALVRWDHPTMGRLEPGAFLPMAERSGLIAALDRVVLARALEHARGWHEQHVPTARVAVNLSPSSLRDRSLPDRIAALLGRHGLPPEVLELEISERVLLDDPALHRVLAALHTLGVRLAIDDLGTGTTALARLGLLPLHTIKLDRSVVGAIGRRGTVAPVVTGLLTMASGLGADVVAEGVETDAQLEFLRASRMCRHAQGFLFSPAVEAERLSALSGSLAPGGRSRDPLVGRADRGEPASPTAGAGLPSPDPRA